MAAARIWPSGVLASDIDEVAVDVAHSNVAANGLTGRVTCYEAAGFAHPQIARAAPFDLVFANILKGPLVALAPDMAAHIKPAGYAILSGILNEQAKDVLEVYLRSGFNLVSQEKIVDWTTLVLARNT
jgi:ribosomal protein L11 methyltransferase